MITMLFRFAFVQKVENEAGEVALVLVRATEEEVRQWRAAELERKRDAIARAAGKQHPHAFAAARWHGLLRHVLAVRVQLLQGVTSCAADGRQRCVLGPHPAYLRAKIDLVPSAVRMEISQ